MTIKKDSSRIIKFVLIALPLLLAFVFYGGYLYGQLNANLSEKNGVVQTDLTNELELCYANQADTPDAPVTETFNASTFKLSSPHFNDREVLYQVFNYRRNSIEARTLQLPNNGFQGVNVTVWNLKHPVRNEYLPTFSSELVNKLATDKIYGYGTIYDFPIFDGYENHGFVDDSSYVSTRIPLSPKLSEVYVSKQGIKMYKSVLACPKANCGVELHFFTFTNRGLEPLFVQITAAHDYLMPENERNVKAAEAMMEIQKIADTITVN
jgi:hypothetical protein